MAEVDVSGRERDAMTYFIDPSYDTLVETLPSCPAPGETPRHAPVLAGGRLARRLDQTFAYRSRPEA